MRRIYPEAKSHTYYWICTRGQSWDNSRKLRNIRYIPTYVRAQIQNYFSSGRGKTIIISWKTNILGNRISSRIEHYLSRFEIRKRFDFLAWPCSASGGQDCRLWHCRAFDSDGNTWLFWNCWLFCSRSCQNTAESKSRDDCLRKKGWCF